MLAARLKEIVRSRVGERGGIVRSVSTLVGGTAFAQLLTVLALPLLTRLYTPSEFSVLAVYAAMLGILVVVACLRLEIAIPLPATDEEAANLFVLSLLSGWTLSLVLGLLILLSGEELGHWLQLDEMAPYIWFIPIGVALASTYSAFQYWSTRKKKFPRIARTRITQALGGIGVQLGAGFAGLGSIGLLAGHAVSGGAGVVGLARDAWKNDRHVIYGVNIYSMRSALSRYSRFPKYSTWEALTNTAGSQLPIILIAAWAVGPEAGYLMLATRLMAAPMALIGGSIAQVYYSHAAGELRAGTLGTFTARVLNGLAVTGVGPLIFAGIVAGPVVTFIFGDQWLRTGNLIAWMTPWFVLKFISSPVSMVMHVKHRQREMMALQLLGLATRVGAIAIAFHATPLHIAEAFALSGAAFYLLCNLVYYRFADVRGNAVLGIVRRALPILLGWVGFGIVVRYSVIFLKEFI